ncbi:MULTISPECIES: hypothetical protein [unclassified Nocardiopsis]|uniref:hypothetical protein n=1 Tax=unclassified Nocardiopsis TaxID=2649073 RepID=UPI00135CF253|nr:MULTISPECIES: hypothetical protein [unclassified Nocardiopsis]
MNPHDTSGHGVGSGPPPPPPVAPGPPPPGPLGQPPPPRGRYGTGLVAVLAVIAVLAGASFLGGGIALGGMLTGRLAAGEEPVPSAGPGGEPGRSPSPTAPTGEPAPTAEPPPEPAPGAVELMSSEDLVAELRRDFGITARQDTTEDICGPADEEESTLFRCTSAMDTNLVRVAAFESAAIAGIAAMAMLESEDGEAQDVQDACHFVLVWFEHNGLDRGERDAMAEAAREAAGCL